VTTSATQTLEYSGPALSGPVFLHSTEQDRKPGHITAALSYDRARGEEEGGDHGGC